MRTESLATPATTTSMRVLHFANYDSAIYRRAARQKPTWCGDWASDRELATHRDLVTCSDCLAQLEHFDAMDIG